MISTLIRNRIAAIACLCSLLMMNTACEKFLSEKGTQSLVIPDSYDDLAALMDANTTVNLGMGPGLLEIGTDDYYLLTSVLNTQNPFEKENYLWEPAPHYTQAATNQQWKNPYTSVFVANTVLDYIDQIRENDPTRYNHVKGTAYFLRAYAFYLLAQAYCAPYDPNGSNQGPGLPLRTDADIATPSTRSTVEETYQQIVSDLKEAATLLPEAVEYAMRPSKAAANAALAKTCLVMENYEKALEHADVALSWYNRVMDYRTKNVTAVLPFEILNEETIFFARASGLSPLNQSRANVDTSLIASYDEQDLRKELFFTRRANGTYAFKGSYTGFNTMSTFVGITTSEVLLIKAECHARQGDVDMAKSPLKTLLDKRYEVDYVFPPIADADRMLRFVLEERRKELVFRGVRWSDLRRLNRDPRFAKTLRRAVVNGGDTTWYNLPPNDPRYTYLIPQTIIQFTDILQNGR